MTLIPSAEESRDGRMEAVEATASRPWNTDAKWRGFIAPVSNAAPSLRRRRRLAHTTRIHRAANLVEQRHLPFEAVPLRLLPQRRRQRLPVRPLVDRQNIVRRTLRRVPCRLPVVSARAYLVPWTHAARSAQAARPSAAHRPTARSPRTHSTRVRVHPARILVRGSRPAAMIPPAQRRRASRPHHPHQIRLL